MTLHELFTTLGAFVYDNPNALNLPVELEVGGDGAIHTGQPLSVRVDLAEARVIVSSEEY